MENGCLSLVLNLDCKSAQDDHEPHTYEPTPNRKSQVTRIRIEEMNNPRVLFFFFQNWPQYRFCFLFKR